MHTTFLRKRFEMGEIQALTTKAVTDVSKPVKDAFEKALKDVNVA